MSVISFFNSFHPKLNLFSECSIANQFKAMMHLAREGSSLETAVHVLPEEFDQEIAGFKLESMGISMDTLSEGQLEYLNAYAEGT